jgi:hypothetical protein
VEGRHDRGEAVAPGGGKTANCARKTDDIGVDIVGITVVEGVESIQNTLFEKRI